MLTSPFMQPAFWQALADHRLIGEGSRWPMTRLEADGHAMPVFLRHDHRGEYVFDQGWAQAAQRAGLDYYPRWVSSVPFTPVQGPRVWPAEGKSYSDAILALAPVLREHLNASHASNWHLLFADDTTRAGFLEHLQLPLIQRLDCQFFWEDQGYGDFDGFLAALTAKRRKSIRSERAKVIAKGIQCRWLEGSQIDASHWSFFYQCYAMTYRVRGQQPYLSLGFFQQLGQTQPESLALCLAESDTGPVAAALFFKDDTTLYGRYWGSLAEVDCLHFEVCYYQGIEYALRYGLSGFDPGTQGEHKLIRGFAPRLSCSLHYVQHEGLREAIAAYCVRENEHVKRYAEAAREALPFKQLA